jgi:hypothetical protein
MFHFLRCLFIPFVSFVIFYLLFVPFNSPFVSFFFLTPPSFLFTPLRSFSLLSLFLSLPLIPLYFFHIFNSSLFSFVSFHYSFVSFAPFNSPFVSFFFFTLPLFFFTPIRSFSLLFSPLTFCSIFSLHLHSSLLPFTTTCSLSFCSF